MERRVLGLHHVTAIARDPQANIDFYTGVLGLRLVKQTVNFDDPGSYHFYYGNGTGEPGTILTFFPWPGAALGRRGAGETTATALSVPVGSLEYWRDRLRAKGVEYSEPAARFGNGVISISDPDGLVIELVEEAVDGRLPWTSSDVPVDRAIRGLHHVTLTENSIDETAAMLELLGYQSVEADGERTRYAVDGGAGYVDVVVDPTVAVGRIAAGSVHHIAFRTEDDDSEVDWLAFLRNHDVGVSDVRDRQYFNSIYFREPGGVLFEIATDTPGFLTDEPFDTLGTELRLPHWYEQYRDRIKAALPKIDLQPTLSKV